MDTIIKAIIGIIALYFTFKWINLTLTDNIIDTSNMISSLPKDTL